MVTPSLMAMVLNSIGVAPAERMPSFTRSARRRRWKLQGIVSVQGGATPPMGGGGPGRGRRGWRGGATADLRPPAGLLLLGKSAEHGVARLGRGAGALAR